MGFIGTLGCVITLLSVGSLGADEPAADGKPDVPKSLTFELEERRGTPQVRPTSIDIEFSNRLPRRITNPPSLDGEPVWAEAPVAGIGIGVGALRVGKAGLQLLVDRNADGTFEGDEIMAVEGFERKTPQGDVGSVSWRRKVQVGRTELELILVGKQSGITGRVTGSGHRRGELPHWNGAARLLLVVLDHDLDSRYGTPGDFWWLGTTDRLDRYRIGFGPHNMVEANEPVFMGDTVWRLTPAQSGTAVVHRVGDAGKLDDYLARRSRRVHDGRRWKLEQDRERFVRDMKLDESRKKTEVPAQFHHSTDLAALVERAKAAGKPLLIELESDLYIRSQWNSQYVYPDAEVSELLKQFYCVRWNVEFGELNIARKVSSKGYPCVAVFDASGETLNVMRHFMSPPKFITQLQLALARYAVRKKPSADSD